MDSTRALSRLHPGPNSTKQTHIQLRLLSPPCPSLALALVLAPTSCISLLSRSSSRALSLSSLPVCLCHNSTNKHNDQTDLTSRSLMTTAPGRSAGLRSWTGWASTSTRRRSPTRWPTSFRSTTSSAGAPSSTCVATSILYFGTNSLSFSQPHIPQAGATRHVPCDMLYLGGNFWSMAQKHLLGLLDSPAHLAY